MPVLIPAEFSRRFPDLAQTLRNGNATQAQVDLFCRARLSSYRGLRETRVRKINTAPIATQSEHTLSGGTSDFKASKTATVTTWHPRPRVGARVDVPEGLAHPEPPRPRGGKPRAAKTYLSHPYTGEPKTVGYTPPINTRPSPLLIDLEAHLARPAR